MPSLIGNIVAANYRKTGPGSRFATRELVLVQVTVANADLTDYTSTDNEDLFNGVTNPEQQDGAADGNFAKAISAIQTQGEIYAIGEPTFGEGASNFTVILAADTFADSSFTGDINSGSMDADNSKATSIDAILTALFDEAVTVTFTRMRGLGTN